jgi:hypothetical protein
MRDGIMATVIRILVLFQIINNGKLERRKAQRVTMDDLGKL